MRVLLALSCIALLVAGCAGSSEDSPKGGDQDADGYSDAVEAKYGTDPTNATLMPNPVLSSPIEFSESVNVVGVGVPGVQCPGDPAGLSSKSVTWTITAETGDAREVWLANVTISLSSAMTVNDVDLFVFDASGKALGSATGSTNAESLTIARAPFGDVTIEARGCSGTGDVGITGTGMVSWIPSDAELLAS